MISLNWLEQHLLTDILPNWLEASVTREGLFLPHLDRQWRQRGAQWATLVSQCRLIHNFAQAYRLTGQQDYLNATQGGARFLMEHFWDAQHGGWFWSCARDGTVLEDRKDGYGHAFALFGLAYAYQCSGDEVYQTRARETWELVRSRLMDAHGGLVQWTARDFSLPPDQQGEGAIRSQNPLMHLFEALLALADTAGLSDPLSAASGVAEFVTARLMRDGMLPELYTVDWRELPSERGGWINLGHHFEWAFLLSRGVQQGLPESLLQPAGALLDRGLQLAWDPAQGGFYGAAAPDGRLLNRRKGWWEQCEAARALMHFAAVRGRDRLWAPFERTVRFFRENLTDPAFGGWYGCYPVGGERDLDKGSHWKVDYHVVSMCLEAIRLSGLPALQDTPTT